MKLERGSWEVEEEEGVRSDHLLARPEDFLFTCFLLGDLFTPTFTSRLGDLDLTALLLGVLGLLPPDLAGAGVGVFFLKWCPSFLADFVLLLFLGGFTGILYL